jgi:glutaredoxin-like protein NrdH
MKEIKVPAKTTKVPGKISKHKVLVYALSTCVWCKKTKQLLNDKSVEYEYVDIDQCNEKEKEEIKKDILKRGGYIGFPCVIVDDKTVINGFREDKIKEALEI